MKGEQNPAWPYCIFVGSPSLSPPACSLLGMDPAGSPRCRWLMLLSRVLQTWGVLRTVRQSRVCPMGRQLSSGHLASPASPSPRSPGSVMGARSPPAAECEYTPVPPQCPLNISPMLSQYLLYVFPLLSHYLLCILLHLPSTASSQYSPSTPLLYPNTSPVSPHYLLSSIPVSPLYLPSTLAVPPSQYPPNIPQYPPSIPPASRDSPFPLAAAVLVQPAVRMFNRCLEIVALKPREGLGDCLSSGK